MSLHGYGGRSEQRRYVRGGAPAPTHPTQVSEGFAEPLAPGLAFEGRFRWAGAISELVQIDG